MIMRLMFMAAAMALLSSCAGTSPRSGTPGGNSVLATGKASYYGPGFHGKTTASGERFDRNAMTAAHKSLPFGTRVRVVNLANDRAVVVRINDRFGGHRGRVIDLSEGAFRRIADPRAGVIDVRVEQVGK